MSLAWLVLGLGVCLTLAGYDYGQKKFRFITLVPGLALILGAPLIDRMIQCLILGGQFNDVVLAALIFLVSVIVTIFMSDALRETDPESTNWIQFALFGFHKWDELICFWIAGALIAGTSALYLTTTLFNAWNFPPPGVDSPTFKSAPIATSEERRSEITKSGKGHKKSTVRGRQKTLQVCGARHFRSRNQPARIGSL
ncbi:MAG: hypothetical protein K2W95_31955 [Candidatus Obscuribacterales bacterium]|nr:hypothetical protein [Candidatus Obscuribacterales bacterium]